LAPGVPDIAYVGGFHVEVRPHLLFEVGRYAPAAKQAGKFSPPLGHIASYAG
jgi:hypothetical protein